MSETTKKNKTKQKKYEHKTKVYEVPSAMHRRTKLLKKKEQKCINISWTMEIVF